MGTVYLAPDYDDVIVPLVKKYTSGDLRDLPQSSIWLDGKEPIKYSSYVFQQAGRYFKVNDSKVLVGLMLQKIGIYVALHQRLFGNYAGEIMPEPTAAVSCRIF